MSTLCCAPGTRRHAPAVLHSQAGVLYEEPLIACLAVTVLHAEGLGTATSPSSRSGSNAAGSSFSLLSRPSGDSISSSPCGSKGLLGGLLRRRRGKGSLVHSNSLGSEASESAAEVMLAGEDAGDECECALHALGGRPCCCFQGGGECWNMTLAAMVDP